VEDFIKSRILRITGKDQFDVSLFARSIRRMAYRLRVGATGFPSNADALKQSAIFKKWWYYTIELLPGITTTGIYPEDFPLLPRVLLRNCELAGLDCLDLGSMEGLIPALMRKQGARKVLATDASFHCYEKMAASSVRLSASRRSAGT
jgi:hypothetical protein